MKFVLESHKITPLSVTFLFIYLFFALVLFLLCVATKGRWETIKASLLYSRQCLLKHKRSVVGMSLMETWRSMIGVRLCLDSGYDVSV